MVSNDHFRHELLARMGRAAARGAKHILINVHDLHCSMGDFPSINECRSAMRAEMTLGDVLILAETNGAGMTVRYGLPRVARVMRDSSDSSLKVGKQC